MSRLEAWKEEKNRNPLVLNGARQVGKTYCLEAFGRQYFKATHLLNFEEDLSAREIFAEDLTPNLILDKIRFHLKSEIDPSTCLIIFDEIQACPKALTSLKYFQEKMPELAICACGSLLGVHLSSESFPVGKVTHMSLHPMTFSEFLHALGEQQSLDYMSEVSEKKILPKIVHEYLFKKLIHYFIVGGLPEVVQIFVERQDDLYDAFRQVRKRQKELLKDYQADIAKHSGKTNAMHVQRVFEATVQQLAKTQDGNAKRFLFQNILPGNNRYARLAGPIDWLVNAGLIIKVPIVKHAEIPLKAFTKENIFKLFIFDTGLLGAMSGLEPASMLKQNYGVYKGYFAENYVLQSFVANKLSFISAWQTNEAEVEFLREIDGKIIPVEVKSGDKTQAKSLTSYLNRYLTETAVILSARPLEIKKALYQIPLYLADRFDDFFA